MTVRARTLTHEHLGALVVVEEAAQPLPWTRAQLEEELQHDDAVVRGAYDDGDTLVGYAAWRQNVHELWLLNLAVIPAQRRKGLARALVDEGPRLAKERDCTDLWLEVRASNESAQRLYEAAGYVVVGKRRGYYRPVSERGAREDAILMRRPVD